MEEVRRIKLHLTNAAGGIERRAAVLEGMAERVRAHLAAIDVLVGPHDMPPSSDVGRRGRERRSAAFLRRQASSAWRARARIPSRERADAKKRLRGRTRVRDARHRGQLASARPAPGLGQVPAVREGASASGTACMPQPSDLG